MRINVSGSPETGKRGILDLLAPRGHMRRIQSGNETLPSDWEKR